MTPSRASVVVFDLGGVLLPFDRERRVRAVAERFGVTPEAVRALEAEVAGPLDRGEIDERALLDGLCALAGEAVAMDEALDLWLSVFEAPNAELWDLAARLKGRVRVAGFSDNPAFVRRVVVNEGLFDPLFLSCEIGAVKPTAEAFEAVRRGLAVEAGEILFVDDSPANVAAAKAAGWDALLFRSNAELLAALAERGLP